MKYIPRIYDTSKRILFRDEGEGYLDSIRNVHRFIESHNLKSGKYYILQKDDGGEVRITSKDISKLNDPSKETDVEEFYFDLNHTEPDVKTFPMDGGMEEPLESIVLNKEQAELLK